VVDERGQRRKIRTSGNSSILKHPECVESVNVYNSSTVLLEARTVREGT
jgi:hypothetical protein